jgi:osmotically-inducible protein OsmY
VQATVRHGWITLNGVVEDAARRAAAERAARQLRGVRGVTNALLVQQQEGRSA